MTYEAPPSSTNIELLSPSPTVSFADVAHQTLIFDSTDPTSKLVLKLIDAPWVQRLRRIRQTGNTRLVYMFAEHSRFGHSLGVAYLAILLMQHLCKFSKELVEPYRDAIAAAALLHDIGHTAPGSHLAARIWAPKAGDQHETVSARVVMEDHAIREILESHCPGLSQQVCRVLAEDPELPPWTRAVISGGGWNADRGNWTIVDSAMCSVSYGRYNVRALIDAFRLSSAGELVIQESRIDALAHFFVARDSMYRQVYQHRVLQAADALGYNVVQRLRDIIEGQKSDEEKEDILEELNIYCDAAMLQVLGTDNYAPHLPLETIFRMTEGWWSYHIECWCHCRDKILSDLSSALRDRRLFKTVRLDSGFDCDDSSARKRAEQELLSTACKVATESGYDPRYYVATVEYSDKHRGKAEETPLVLLDNGSVVKVTEVEPLIRELLTRPERIRRWIVVPKKVKEKLGRYR